MRLMKTGFQRDRIIIFGRYPRPGKVKTRLIPVLGAAGAAELQKQLTRRTLSTVGKFAARRPLEAEFCFDGGSREKIRRWLGERPLLSKQEPGGLGTRMRAAFQRAFRSGCGRVVLVGTDIPELKSRHLETAFRALDRHDLVIGPGTDGGYWLIGLKEPLNMFEGIDWGTNRVLKQTLALAEAKGISPFLMDPLSDLDTPEDLEQWRPGRLPGRPYLSVIIPALNESASLFRTIERAKDPDAEIIVVDGGSTDGTLDAARLSGAAVMTTEKGRAVQQNAGACSARGTVLLFLHADTRPPPGYVRHVFETLMPRGTAAGAFRFQTDARIPLMNAVERVTNFRARRLQLPYGDQGIFLKKSLFRRVGGFPPVSIAEDLLLVRRLRKHGRIRIAEVPAVTSGRRWQRLGIIRTTWINQMILMGYCLGISSRVLAALYSVPGAEGYADT